MNQVEEIEARARDLAQRVREAEERRVVQRLQNQVDLQQRGYHRRATDA